MKTRVINVRSLGDTDKKAVLNNIQHEDMVYIGRMPRKHKALPKSTRIGWGNPFVLGDSSPEARTECIRKYREDLKKKVRSGDITLEELAKLKGKTLVCWCKPKLCHGDVLRKAVIWAHKKLQGKQTKKKKK